MQKINHNLYIEELIDIASIEEVDFDGDVYSLKIKNDPSFCLANRIVTCNCDMPDADIDVEDVRRDDVKGYLKEQYGEFNVAAISTFLRMKSKLVVRDVGRVFDVDLLEVDKFSKSIRETIDDGLESDEGKSFQRSHPEVIYHAKQLEGQIRNGGMHAAGIIVADEDLRKSSRCYLTNRRDVLTVNWDGPGCERMGLIKLDLLGLNTLSVLTEAKNLLKARGIEIDYEKLPLDDQNIFADMSNGHVSGIFQMGYAVRALLNEISIENISDWSDVIALARPGPYDCITGDTLIRCWSGATMRIDEIDHGRPIPSSCFVEGKGNRYIRNKIKRIIPTGVKSIFELLTDDNKIIKCSSGHRFFVKKKREPLRSNARRQLYDKIGEWIELKYIEEGDLVLTRSLNKTNRKFGEHFEKLMEGGRNTRFKKGDIPWNKNVKRYMDYTYGGERQTDRVEKRRLEKWRENLKDPNKYQAMINNCLKMAGNRWDEEERKRHSNTMIDYYSKNPHPNSLGINISKPQLLVYFGAIKWFHDAELEYLFSYEDLEGRTRFYNMDVAIPSEKIDIEYDGEYWHDNPGSREEPRDSIIESHGWTIIRLTEKNREDFVANLPNITKPNGVKWSKVVSIKSIGEEKTYDIETENQEFPNYIANDFITHNSGMTSLYIERKKGGEWKPKHPIFEDVTKNTLGICCYQESIMNVIHRVAGLPYHIADKIRKIIGKKRDPKAFEQFKDMFVNGCIEQETLTEKEANEFWDELQYHANYSFNQCLSGSEVIFGRYSRKKKRYFTIEEIYRIKNDINYAIASGSEALHHKNKLYGYGTTLSMCEDRRIRKNVIKDIYYSGDLKVFKLTTECGKTLKCTMNHKLPTPNGTKLLSELNIGDKIFVKGEYEKDTIDKKKYNFYKDGETKTNFPKPGQSGFQKRNDGPSVLFSEFCVRKREEMSSCDICGKLYDQKTRFEGHHIDGDRKNNQPDNLQFLCVSCHKKEHYSSSRTKIYEKGIPTVESKIISIEYVGIEKCFDVEMEGPNHNFVTQNGIVVSNSHSLSYAIVGYWTAYVRHYYPSEFIAASLTHGRETSKRELVSEARRLGLDVIPPRMGKSDSMKWICNGKKLYVPFKEIKGVGEKTAIKLGENCLNKEVNKKRKGFFVCDEKAANYPSITGKTRDLLERVGAFSLNEDLPQGGEELFDFSMTKNLRDGYPKLLSILGKDFNEKRIADALEGNVRGLKLFSKSTKAYKLGKELSECKKCELREECPGPVYPSTSRNPIMIVGEAPFKDESKQGKPFVGRVSAILWDTLKKFDLMREDFYITNAVKCPPLSSKNPSPSHVLTCRFWLEEEIRNVKPFLILSLGRLARLSLIGEEKGIIKANGTVVWSEEFGAWIVFAAHPGYVNRNKSYLNEFESALNVFNIKIQEIGGV